MVDIWLVDYKFDLFFDRSRIFAMATNFGDITSHAKTQSNRQWGRLGK